VAPIAQSTNTRGVLTTVTPFERRWAGGSGAARRVYVKLTHRGADGYVARTAGETATL
jgi:hypothetical protein